MGVITGTQGSLYIAAAENGTAFSAEATTEDAYVYQINNAAKRIWDPNTPPTLSTGTLDVTWMDKGVDYFTGRVKLTETGKTLTLSGTYISTLVTIGCVFGWTLSLNRTGADITPVGVSWKQSLGLEAGADLTVNRYRVDSYFATLVNSTSYLMVKLLEDASTGFWVKALLAGLNMNKAVGQVDTEPLTFAVDGAVGEI